MPKLILNLILLTLLFFYSVPGKAAYLPSASATGSFNKKTKLARIHKNKEIEKMNGRKLTLKEKAALFLLLLLVSLIFASTWFSA